jgi:hypothetical protein
MLTIYHKSEMADLSPTERKALALLVKSLE